MKLGARRPLRSINLGAACLLQRLTLEPARQVSRIAAASACYRGPDETPPRCVTCLVWACPAPAVRRLLPGGVTGGGSARRISRSGDGVGVLNAHLTLEAVRVPEEDAEDGTEIGDEVITGAPGDQPVPDLVKSVERRGLQPEMVDAAPPEHR